MDNLINKILFYIKIILLLIAFTVTLYILLIRMDTNGLSTLSIFPLFIPLFLVLMAFVFSFFLNIGKNQVVFNVVCVLVLLAIIFIDYRAIFDSNIISKTKINLNYFDIQMDKIKIMLYLTFFSNILLAINERKKDVNKIIND